MKVIRPVQPNDLDDLVQLAKKSIGGITSLPTNPDLLQWKIERSQFAFSVSPLRPNGEAYFFVLEDTEKRKVIGCSGILSRTGGYEPIGTYKMGTMTLESKQAKIHSEVPILELQTTYDGPTEVCSLFLMPAYRKGGLGRLLSLSRFCFIALNRKRFTDTVMASLRGVLDKHGNSAFWEGVCRSFFNLDFSEANVMRYSDPRFIHELVPPFPLCIPLLHESVQEVIGKTHPNTQPALNMLIAEGLTFNGEVDIFDGGPYYTAPVAHLRAVKELSVLPIKEIAGHDNKKEYLVCNTRLDFRATYGHLTIEGDGLVITEETAKALNVHVHDPVAFMRPHPTKE